MSIRVGNMTPDQTLTNKNKKCDEVLLKGQYHYMISVVYVCSNMTKIICIINIYIYIYLYTIGINLRYNSPLSCFMVILTWGGIIYLSIVYLAIARC
jgi:hypothetical protein